MQLKLNSNASLISYLFDIYTFTYKWKSFYKDYNYE